MKKMLFQTKYLIGLVVLLFLAIAIPTVIFSASLPKQDHYTAPTASTTPGAVATSIYINSYNVSNAPFNVYNLSSQTYLVPNNSAAEFTAFYNHAPIYMPIQAFSIE
jgi:hypothetical protein